MRATKNFPKRVLNIKSSPTPEPVASFHKNLILICANPVRPLTSTDRCIEEYSRRLLLHRVIDEKAHQRLTMAEAGRAMVSASQGVNRYCTIWSVQRSRLVGRGKKNEQLHPHYQRFRFLTKGAHAVIIPFNSPKAEDRPIIS